MSDTTYNKLSSVVTCPGTREECPSFVRSCPVCQPEVQRGAQLPGLMQPDISESSSQITACDVMEPFPPNPPGFEGKWGEQHAPRKLTSKKMSVGIGFQQGERICFARAKRSSAISWSVHSEHKMVICGRYEEGRRNSTLRLASWERSP